MNRTAACLAIFFSSLTLAGQNGSSSGPVKPVGPQVDSPAEGTVIVLPPINGACPVYMHASQGLWDRTIRVREGEKERVLQPFGQRIYLSLKGSHPARVVAATVRVRGSNGKNRTLPTPADTAKLWNAVRTLRVNFAEETDGTVSSDIWVGGFTAVGSIQLIDVTYSDGSMWKISSSNACRVQPDPVMLITER